MPKPQHQTDTAVQRGRLHLLLLPVAALIVVAPLLVNGCSCGHDFDFHLLNWLEAARQFTHGNLLPQWAFPAAWNAGEPRFVFYPPFSWMLGAMLGLLLPWTWAPIAYTWIILTASGLALRRLARSFVGPTPALLAATFYLANPYILFTAYERTAYAELLAGIWMPLLLHSILRPESEGGPTIPRIALPVALLWLSNAPAAVMGCYALALLAALRLILERQHRLRHALNILGGTALGLGLSAFYLVPAALERRYVQIQMAILPGLRIQDNTVFHHTTAGVTNPAALGEAIFHDQVLHTASDIALLLLALTAIALTVSLFRKRAEPHAPQTNSPLNNNDACVEIEPQVSSDLAVALRARIYPLAAVTVAVAFMLTPLSIPIWLHAPELAFLQFPWRLLALLAPVTALSLAIALHSLRLKPAAAIPVTLALAVALTLPSYSLFRQSCDPDDTVPARVALFRSNQGSEPTDEYTPIAADNDSLAQVNPPYWLSTDPDAPAPANLQPGPAPIHLSLHLNQPEFLILNLRDYPSWDVTTTDSQSMHLQRPVHIPRDDGLIAIDLPYAADHSIDISYTQLPDQIIGKILTALSLTVLSLLTLRKTRT